MKTRQGCRPMGFTLVELMIVIAIIGLLISIAIQGCARAKENAKKRVIVSALTNAEPVGQYFCLTNTYIQRGLYDIGNLAGAIHDYRVFKIEHPNENVLLIVSEEPSLGVGYFIWRIPTGREGLSTNSPVELK